MIFESYFLKALILIALLSGVPLMLTSFFGLIVAVLQASTQVQEQTITFFVKFLGLVLLIYFLGPVFLALIKDFVQDSFSALALFGDL